MRALQRPAVQGCRRRRSPPAPAALFGFGSKPEQAEKAAPKQPAAEEAGPVLTPFTPIQKTPDYSLRLYK